MRVALTVTASSSGELPAKKAHTGLAAAQSTASTTRIVTIWYLSVHEMASLRRAHALAPALKATMGCRPYEKQLATIMVM